MPISLTQLAPTDKFDSQALEAIIKDLDADDTIRSSLAQWQNQSLDSSLYIGWFNDRMVALALLEAQQLRALAVHPATRGRGVATRVLELIKAQVSDVDIPSDGDCAVFNKR